MLITSAAELGLFLGCGFEVAKEFEVGRVSFVGESRVLL